MLFDAVLLLSFGGPEGPQEVRPFLENVTRGRGIPPERLDEVAEHYFHFGGVSPINGINRALIDQISRQLELAGHPLPVFFGNRNWHPMVEDTVADMRDKGIRRAAVFTTSAWGGYSGCKQYVEDIARARAAVGDGAPELVKLRQYFDHPSLVQLYAEAVSAAMSSLRGEARLVFTAHSIPLAADRRHGPELYSRQVHYLARLVAAATGHQDYDVVWQSRSGPPQVPWLEPDIVDHLAALKDRGIRSVAVAPIGFVSDHLEVVWDLDNEAREYAQEHDIELARAATPGADERFARLAVDLITEVVEGRPALRASGVNPVPGYGFSVNGALCSPLCCGVQEG
ncbi:Ferrochelatase (Protoheme ferro-lyase) [Mycobacteroides abscessus]|uniref:Coproporphyrin III ferrochelatase n=3 Tax=Mycobacteroides abscessus TaxID=36809 RepID=A0A829HVC3_9MYCO|nr:ferrochelatase [Mycobacteroides abscessus]ESV60579.1 ferrochelatase [Mycobacteroides abscessus MAB_082312_2258]ESV63853.1 ferrochelatase [Mycobacteroides abscessus MAB_091912_2446]AFN63627.1 ferrochelatase [Mycobacteroides abscessus subsp. massiliense str. GO 06]AMU26331.1 ferrochelatase [Mycobacteroides abscessus]AMU36011.1 ferrochelatase [Mycobacteroides abscessus]